MRTLPWVLIALCLTACATTQGKFRPLGASYPPKAADFAVEVFENGAPLRPYERIARLDAHFEKTTFITTSHSAGLMELKQQARAAGADAIIEVREKRSQVGETMILHVSGMGIRYIPGSDGKSVIRQNGPSASHADAHTP
jgi:hypothetical protein